MPTDPTLLRIGGRSGLNLDTTPGSISTPGQITGGEYQVGAPSMQVGISAQESMYGTLAEIAGNLIKSVQTGTQINDLLADREWKKFKELEWNGPNSTRTKLLDLNNPVLDPQTNQPITQEQTYDQIRGVLDRAPSIGRNAERRSELFGQWLQEDPDRRELFKKLAIRFNKANEKLNPNEKLTKFNSEFKYFLDAGVPESQIEQTSLTRVQLEYNTNLAVASARINTLTYLGNFGLVLNARQQEKLGNSSVMSQVKQVLGDTVDFASLLSDVDSYMESPTRENLKTKVDSVLGTKPQGAVYDTYDNSIAQLSEELTTTHQSNYEGKAIDNRQLYEQRMFNSAALTLQHSGFTDIQPGASGMQPYNITESALKVSGLITVGSSNSTPEQVSGVVQALTNAFVEQGRRSNLTQDQLLQYSIDTWTEVWTCLEPSQKRYILQNNILGPILDPNLSLEETEIQIEELAHTYELPDTLKPAIKDSILHLFETTTKYAMLMKTQFEGATGTIPIVFNPTNSGTIGLALEKIAQQNGVSASSGFTAIHSLVHIGLGQELFEDSKEGRLLWVFGLGLDPKDYDRWVLAVKDPNNKDLQDIVSKYGVKELGRSRNLEEWISTEPSLLERTQHDGMSKVLDRFYKELTSYLGDGAGDTRPGLFTASQLNDLSHQGTQRESAQVMNDIAGKNPKARGVTQIVTNLCASIQFGKVITVGGKEYTFPFTVPTGYKDGETVIPLPEEQLQRVLESAQASVKRMAEDKVTQLSTQSQYSQELMWRKNLGEWLFIERLKANPGEFIGDKEDQEQQILALSNFVRLVSQEQTAFQQFFSPLDASSSQLSMAGTPFHSSNAHDNDLSKMSFQTQGDQLTTDGTRNHARLTYRVATDLYDIEEIKGRLKTSLSVLADVKTGDDLAHTLQANPDTFYFLHAVVSGIIEKAARGISNNEMSQSSLDGAIQAEISKVVSTTESSKFAPFLRGLALAMIEENDATGHGVIPLNFRTADPNETFKKLKALGDTTMGFREDQEAVLLKAFKTYLNLASKLLQPFREREYESYPSDSGFAGTTQPTSGSALDRIRTLFRAKSQTIKSQVSGDINPEKDRKDGIEVIVSSWESAGIKIDGNTPYEKYENLLIHLSSMHGGNLFQHAREGNGGPETRHITNVFEPGGVYESDWNAEYGPGAEESNPYGWQNIGSSDPTSSVFMMMGALGTGFEPFLEFAIPGLEQNGSVSLSDLSTVWQDYQNYGAMPNTFRLVNQRTAVDFSGRNERVLGEITYEDIPRTERVWYDIALLHPPLDYRTRDVTEVENLSQWSFNPMKLLGLNDSYQEPAFGRRTDAMSFSYVFAPRNANDRKREPYARDIMAILDYLGDNSGHFKLDLTDPAVVSKVQALATQLEEDNKSFEGGFNPDKPGMELAGTTTNAYMFLEIKRVFFGDNLSDRDGGFLPITLFDTGEGNHMSQALLAGNRQAAFSIRWPNPSQPNRSDPKNPTPWPPTLKHHMQVAAKPGSQGITEVTSGSPTIDTGIPLIPQLMPNFQPLQQEGSAYSGLSGNSRTQVQKFASDSLALGEVYKGLDLVYRYPASSKAIHGSGDGIDRSVKIQFSEEEIRRVRNNPWAYVRLLSERQGEHKVPSFVPMVFPEVTNLPPTPVGTRE